jgi:hypothetical protein
LRLATSPVWTGSTPELKTTGIVVVAALAASAAVELTGVTMTVTRLGISQARSKRIYNPCSQETTAIDRSHRIDTPRQHLCATD